MAELVDITINKSFNCCCSDEAKTNLDLIGNVIVNQSNGSFLERFQDAMNSLGDQVGISPIKTHKINIKVCVYSYH